MHFDDRLATVLRHRAAGDRAARTQFRQLLDLLGSRRLGRDESMVAAAWLRLAALGETIPAIERADMLREPGLRFRNPELALHLAEDEPEVAAAALGVAQLSLEDWEALVPRLPIRARGFLRLRRDLAPATQELLERLGIRDRGLPAPPAPVEERPVVRPLQAPPVPANDLAGDEARQSDDSAIGALVRRIELFRKDRAARPRSDESPRLPLDESAPAAPKPVAGFAFATDADGRIAWADPAVAPMVEGALLPPAAEAARRQRGPLRQVELAWDGAPAVTGSWVIDATPRFSDPGGHFIGYAGRFRRPPPPTLAAPPVDPAAERMRQLLHELKTPVNAIQGFAEVIQQQLFGPTPHEYRALAATIAGDAARMLAGFEELERLAKLETGALTLDRGSADLARIAQGLAAQLGEVLRARAASFVTQIDDQPCPVSLGSHEAEAMCWRLLATITGTAGAGEEIMLQLALDEQGAVLRCGLPASLSAHTDVFAAAGTAARGAVSAGMFGAGFALRLARAEARAAGGDLIREADALLLTLPRLTADETSPSQVVAGAGQG